MDAKEAAVSSRKSETGAYGRDVHEGRVMARVARVNGLGIRMDECMKRYINEYGIRRSPKSRGPRLGSTMGGVWENQGVAVEAKERREQTEGPEATNV